MTEQLFIDKNNYKETMLLDAKLFNGDPYSTFRKRVLWTTSTHQDIDAPSSTSFSANAFEQNPAVDAIFSIPSYCYLLDKSMDEISYSKLQIKLKDGLTTKQKVEIQEKMQEDFKEAFSPFGEFYSFRLQEEDK